MVILQVLFSKCPNSMQVLVYEIIRIGYICFIHYSFEEKLTDNFCVNRTVMLNTPIDKLFYYLWKKSKCYSSITFTADGKGQWTSLKLDTTKKFFTRCRLMVILHGFRKTFCLVWQYINPESFFKITMLNQSVNVDVTNHYLMTSSI